MLYVFVGAYLVLSDGSLVLFLMVLPVLSFVWGVLVIQAFTAELRAKTGRVVNTFEATRIARDEKDLDALACMAHWCFVLGCSLFIAIFVGVAMLASFNQINWG